MTWFVYVIECRDGSLYTGIALDVAKRYAMHAAGKGARYTRAHPPVRVLATFAHPDRSSALQAEYAVKLLSAEAKRALCAQACRTSPTHPADGPRAAGPARTRKAP